MDNKPSIVIGILRLAVLGLWLFTQTLTAQNPNIKCYFNKTVNTSVSTGVNAVYLNTTFVDTAVAYINRAKYSLDVAMYNYTYNSGDGLDAIANAVNAAYTRGVVVRWIHDGSTGNTGLPLLNSGIPKLASPTSISYGIMHNKFMVIDVNSTNANDAFVWTGSFNFSRNQSDVDYNNIIIFQDKPLALAYYAEFNKMWGGTGATPNLSVSKFGPFKTPSSQSSFTVNGTQVEVYFSPKDQTTSQIINSIATCSSDLFFGIYTFTDTTLANTILNTKNSGKNVRGIMDSFSQNYSPFTILSGPMGSSLLIYSGAGLYHNKTMLIDAQMPWSDPQTITGSHNWSVSANTKNDENTVVVHDPTVTNQYYQSLCKNFSDLGGAACLQVGMDETESGLAAFIYPNPAQELLMLDLAGDLSLNEVALLDLLGNKLNASLVKDGRTIKFDLASLSPGMYLITVQSGNRSYSAKFVKN